MSLSHSSSVMFSIAAGVVELVSIFLFFYNMLKTLLPSAQQH